MSRNATQTNPCRSMERVRDEAIKLRRLSCGTGQPDIIFPAVLSPLRHRLVGLVVKASASRADDPGFESRFATGFLRVESYQ